MRDVQSEVVGDVESSAPIHGGASDVGDKGLAGRGLRCEHLGLH